MTIDAHPLTWPAHRARTPSWRREPAKFETTFARARDEIVAEVARLTDTNLRYRRPDVIISTNIPLRRDGLPLANQRAPSDPGVAVYFEYRKRPMCFACDRWTTVQDNMRAISKTIEALRGIARWGTGDMLEAAFTGFTAITAPAAEPEWHEVLGVAPAAPLDEIRAAYRRAAAQHHPDRGGDTATMARVNAAWQKAQEVRR
ncbi:MAG: J domain-containing protein [Burkholderiales bacterium]|jgi:hypothetical protein